MSEMAPEHEPVTVVIAGVAHARAGAPDTGPAVGAGAGLASAHAGAPVIGGEPPPETMPGWEAALSQPADTGPEQDEETAP